MSESVQMPPLGESVTEGTVTRWLKREGERVEVDEPLLEVSTDKVDTEIPAPISGVVERILVAEDETVPIGAELARIGAGVAPASAPVPPPAPASAPVPPPPPASAPMSPPPPASAPVPPPSPAVPAPAASPAPPAPTTAIPPAPPATPGPAVVSAPGTVPLDGNAYVTPLVRRLAAEHGIDLSTMTGTGVGGRIRKQDVLDAIATRTPAPTHTPHEVSRLRGTREPMPRLRKVIAARMVESLQTTAQLTTVVEADVTRIAQLRERVRPQFRSFGLSLSYLPFFALAAVEALQQYPVLNASIEGEEIVYHGQENLGIAVDTDRGLLVPVIHGAAALNVAELARKIADLAERTRGNRISPDELGGGTFTLTNTGSRGALFDTPILFPPQVAILGTGAVVRRPVVLTDEEGQESLAVRSVLNLALSYDHRLVDGADAARFLTTVKARLEEGAFEAVLGL
jgi:pyruvate dehydrogenase E2 component (dihydrolipoamide acetyltransferase)